MKSKRRKRHLNHTRQRNTVVRAWKWCYMYFCHRRAQHVSNGGNCVSTLWPFNRNKKLAGLLILLGTWLFVTTRRNVCLREPRVNPPLAQPFIWSLGFGITVLTILFFGARSGRGAGRTGENIMIRSDWELKVGTSCSIFILVYLFYSK